MVSVLPLHTNCLSKDHRIIKIFCKHDVFSTLKRRTFPNKLGDKDEPDEDLIFCERYFDGRRHSDTLSRRNRATQLPYGKAYDPAALSLKSASSSAEE